jgi:hypothetical protein
MARQVHLVRGRFGRYEAIDFLALLFGYAISGERTLQAYFERLSPFAAPAPPTGCPSASTLGAGRTLRAQRLRLAAAGDRSRRGRLPSPARSAQRAG